MILIKENVNNIDEFNYLYDAVGWGSYEKEISRKSLKILYILYQYMKKIKL